MHGLSGGLPLPRPSPTILSGFFPPHKDRASEPRSGGTFRWGSGHNSSSFLGEADHLQAGSAQATKTFSESQLDEFARRKRVQKERVKIYRQQGAAALQQFDSARGQARDKNRQFRSLLRVHLDGTKELVKIPWGYSARGGGSSLLEIEERWHGVGAPREGRGVSQEGGTAGRGRRVAVPAPAPSSDLAPASSPDRAIPHLLPPDMARFLQEDAGLMRNRPPGFLQEDAGLMRNRPFLQDTGGSQSSFLQHDSDLIAKYNTSSSDMAPASSPGVAIPQRGGSVRGEPEQSNRTAKSKSSPHPQ